MPTESILNRKALRDFHIIDRFEAGVELRGTEVKSIRAGLANLTNAFARIERDEVWLYDMDIQPYERASHEQHAPKRARKLLLHRREIDKLHGQTAVKGCTLVALKLFWKGHRVKIELGVGKGKDSGDKRQDLKKRVVQREADREVAHFNRKRG